MIFHEKIIKNNLSIFFSRLHFASFALPGTFPPLQTHVKLLANILGWVSYPPQKNFIFG